MLSVPHKFVLTLLVFCLLYLGFGGALYTGARLDKALIHTSSHRGKTTASHGISPGEFRPDGALYLVLLYPFAVGETALWYLLAPVGSPYSEQVV